MLGRWVIRPSDPAFYIEDGRIWRQLSCLTEITKALQYNLHLIENVVQRSKNNQYLDYNSGSLWIKHKKNKDISAAILY